MTTPRIGRFKHHTKGSAKKPRAHTPHHTKAATPGGSHKGSHYLNPKHEA
jgi:hypothetical protein